MPAPTNTSPTTNSAGNLFLEADPDHSPPRPGAATPTGGRRRAAPGPRAGGGDRPARPRSHPAAPAAARFTRPCSRLDTALAMARKRLRRAEANAARTLRRPAGRPYGALVALARAGTLLLALSWLGLTLHATTVAEHNALRRQAALAATLGTDQARIATLSGQLQQTQLALQRAQAKATTRNTKTPVGAPPPRQARS